MMYNGTNKIRNIALPENLFSNLGESKKPKIVPIVDNNEIKVDNNYRDRITKMYNKIEDLTPINNEINNTLYFNNYVEKGIVVKPKVSSLKQFWTEYRLIKNEKDKDKENIIPETKEKADYGTNFDELFNALSVRVDELNTYIDELKEMRNDINISSNKLEQDTSNLKDEKEKFMDYKRKEEEKIAKEKATLKNNYNRLQNIINDLDRKLSEIER